MQPNLRYRAFISYAHSDEKWARWVHSRIERYRIPKDLVGRSTETGTVPTSLRPVFRDRDEIAGGHHHDSVILAALAQSSALIVICSPTAAERLAVIEEVRLFRWLYPERPVIPVIVEGTYPECFPPSLRNEVTRGGDVTDIPLRIIGADLQPKKDGKRLGLSKIIAGIIGVGADEIQRRAEKRAMQNLRRWIGALSAAAILLVVVAVWAEVNRREAADARRNAEVGESLYLAQRARAEIEHDGLKAVQIALLGLPLDHDHSSRALVHNAKMALLEVVRSAWLPISQQEGFDGHLHSAKYSSDGTQIITISGLTVRIWDASTGKPAGIPIKHTEVFDSAELSRDNTLVATTSGGGVRIWNAHTGEIVHQLIQDRSGSVQATFSPDGVRIVTTSDDGLRVWDARSGRLLAGPTLGCRLHPSGSYSPDGDHFVTTCSDTFGDLARIWDARTGAAAGSPIRDNAGIRSATYVPSGTRIVTQSEDGFLRLWDTATGKEVAVIGHQGAHASFTSDGSRLVTASDGGDARVWDARSGEQLGALTGGSTDVYEATFSPDGSQIVTVNVGGSAHVWDAHTFRLTSAPIRGGSGVFSASFSPDGAHIVTTESDGFRIWKAFKEESDNIAVRHDAYINEASFSPAGTHIVTASYDGTARVWDARTGEPVGDPLKHDAAINSASFSLDGAQIVTASDDGTVRVWSARTGELVGAPMQHDKAVDAATFSPDGARIVAWSDDGTSSLWDAKENVAVAALNSDDVVSTPKFSPDGALIVAVVVNNADINRIDIRSHVRLWDARTGLRVGGPIAGESAVFSASFSPDGASILTASEDRRVRVWATRSGQLMNVMEHDKAITSATFSPDGVHIVTASSDGTARVWDARTGALVRGPIGLSIDVENRHLPSVFSPDTTHFATMHGGYPLIWDMVAGELKSPPTENDHVYIPIAFSPDGTFLLIKDSDGAAYIHRNEDFSLVMRKVREMLVSCLPADEIRATLLIEPRQIVLADPDYCLLKRQ